MEELLKPGRPKKDSQRDALVHVGFKADPPTVEAIEKLAMAVSAERGVVAAKSVAIRRALIEAALRLDDKKTSTKAEKEADELLWK